MSIGATYPMPGTREWEDWMLDGIARHFVAHPEESRRVWQSWARPGSKYAKTPDFMQRLKDRIVQLKGED